MAGRRTMTAFVAISCAVAAASWSARGAETAADPFAFFSPTVTLSAADRDRLTRGEPISVVLPADPGEIAIFAAVPIDAAPERLLAWMRDIAALKKSEYVLAISRFSDPPRPEDLAALALDDDDLEALRVCHPGDCALKLSAEEMARLRQAAGARDAGWKGRTQQAFRDLVLERVRAYVARGADALPPIADQQPPVTAGDGFRAVLRRSVFLTQAMPAFARHLEQYPAGEDRSIESFLYWSKEKVGGRASVAVTHVHMLRGDGGRLPDVIVAGRQVFATHYMTGSLSLTTLVTGDRRYLAYLNRSRVDVLGRWYGGLVRMIVARRVGAEATDVLQGIRRRVEGGEPPTPRP